MEFYQSKLLKIDKTGDSAKIVLPPDFVRKLESDKLVALHCPEFIIYVEEKNVNRTKLRFSNF
jgi:hypothetical protein